jgi:hypothetical protein
MTSDELHRRADKLSRERQIPHSAALSILGRAGARARRRHYGSTVVERGAFAAVEPPNRPQWWQDWN